MNGKDIVSGVISALFLSRPASAWANEGLALSPPASALPRTPPPLYFSGWRQGHSQALEDERGVGKVFKTQSPESALPKELLRLGVSREGRGTQRGWRRGGRVILLAAGPDS